DRFQAIVDPEQTAILAIGRVLERPLVSDGAITVAPQFELTLSVDHRTLDGAEAGRYLETVCTRLEA
ncbi:MAG TPA: 2-oxo acid dehydrogenase subunit E2, partial [Solirubrobacteraceae bacterium]|nr:2-oxo acid dehydrogenase subunit E2 [Solirubrobacteraceae bacterium]